MIERIKRSIVGKKSLQPLYKKLHSIGLRGMNYGLGGMIGTSGELFLISYIFEALKSHNRIVLFDVGANDGKYTAALLERFKSQAEIHCFEPDQNSFSQLHLTYSDQKKVILNQFGLSAKEEELTLYYDTEGSGWASLYPREASEFSKGLEKTQTVSLKRLDEYCRHNVIPQVSFMKIDVEGFELEVLKGAGEFLENVLFIQFEFSFANQDSKTYMKDFYDILSGFKIYRILQDGLELVEYDPKFEIFMTTNFLAVNEKYEK